LGVFQTNKTNTHREVAIRKT